MLGPDTRHSSRHAPPPTRTPDYLFGYPRATLRLWSRELSALALSSALFVVAPAITALSLFVSPWHLGGSWSLVGLPLAVVLAAIAVFAAREFGTAVRERFGIRVVPQFERPLDPGPETYLCGHSIAARMQHLDTMAAASGVRPLSQFGFGRRDDRGGAWFDCAHASATVAALLALVDPSSALHAELTCWSRALRRAEESDVGFRLVLVSGTAMNGPLWDQLRAAGY